MDSLAYRSQTRRETCGKCLHSVENVLEYSGTVIIILHLNSFLVFHDELYTKIKDGLPSKLQLLFINVFWIVPTFSFFGVRRIHFFEINYVKLYCRSYM